MFGLGIYKKKNIEVYKETIKNDDRNIMDLKQEILLLKDKQKLIQYIEEIKKSKYESIIDIGINKGEPYVLIKRVTHNSLNISMKNSYMRQTPDVHASLSKEYSCSKLDGICSPNKVVSIIDIDAITKRRGNGRILIDALILYAREHMYEKIIGELTDEDKNDTPGLPEFYREMGFIVNEDESSFVMELYY